MKNRLDPPSWPVAPFRRSVRLARLNRYLGENLAQPLTAADAARLVNLEPSSFSKFFRRKVGMTFSKWVRLVRTARALDLLHETDIPISWIAIRSGLGSLRSLERAVSEAVGVPPRKFREMSRSGEN